MKWKPAIGVAMVAATMLQGCAGVATTPVGAADDVALGPVYFLPTTEIPLYVSVHPTEGWVAVSASDPIYRRGSEPLRLMSIYSPFHAETFHPKINAAGLLEEITYDSDGRIDEALVNLAKSAGALVPQSAPITGGAGAIDVFSEPIDLAALATGPDGTVPEAMRSLNARINRAIASVPPPAKAKSFLARFGGRADTVTLSVERLAEDPPGGAAGKPAADCSVGFCYRLPVPYRITATFADGTVQSRPVAVPNGSRTYAAALTRGAFTKWTNKVDLDNGMLREYRYATDGSEGERLAALPFEMVGGFIAGLTQQGALFDAQSTTIEKQIALANLRKDANAAVLGAPESFIPNTPFFVMSAGLVGENRQTGQTLDRPGGPATPGKPKPEEGFIEGPGGAGGQSTDGNRGTGG